MCTALKVSPSSYYSRNRQILSKKQRKTALINKKLLQYTLMLNSVMEAQELLWSSKAKDIRYP